MPWGSTVEQKGGSGPGTPVPKLQLLRWRGLLAPWRELLFWTLLLSASASLTAASTIRQIVGLAEAAALLVLAVATQSRLTKAGMTYARWERIPQSAAWRCISAGVAAALIVAGVARLSTEPLGLGTGWNRLVLIVVVGPILEEIVFRGYLMTFLLWLSRRLAAPWHSMTPVGLTAVAFAAAHIANPHVTWVQLICILFTGCLYGVCRLRYRSTVAAVLSHSSYNLAVYLVASHMGL